jgi:hypothetical protein
MRGAPSAVRPILVLGDQSFQAHQAGVSEEIRTDLALLEVRQEDAIDAPSEQSGQVSLAHAQRQLANVFAIGDQDIESVELHLVIVLAAVQSVEVGSTVNSEQYRFAVDYKRGAPIAQSRFNDERILIRPVVAVAGDRRTRCPSLWTISRYPSCFTSCSQSFPAGTVVPRLGMQGSKADLRMPHR